MASPAQQGQAVALLTELRQAANPDPFFAAPHAPVILTWPGFWGNINYATVTPRHVQIASLVDQYNLMTYAMAGAYQGWQSWYFSALAGATPTTPTSITQPSGQQHWDDNAKQSSYSYAPAWTRASGEMVSYPSYESEQSIAAKGGWAQGAGLGGVIVWTINYGLVGETDNARMQAVKKAFSG